MLPFTLAEAAITMGARHIFSVRPWEMVTSATQDSRLVQPGSLFFALPGNHVDGHNYVQDAHDKGAIAAVVERLLSQPIPQLLVPSTLVAFGDLARAYRARFDIPVVSVTGSVGKTSTKELIAHSISGALRTHKSRKNFNNQLGVPIELFLLDRSHQVSVVELAMRGPGEIGYLARIARSTIAVITNIGMSHIEQLGSREAIATAKSEVLTYLDSEAVAVLNRNDDFFEFLRRRARCRVISFGHNSDADFRITQLRYSASGNPSFMINGVAVTMESAMGAHHAENAAAAFAVTSVLNIPAEDVSERMRTFRTPERRGVFSTAKSGAMILDSTYNAAPDSMKASLATLSGLRGRGVHTVAVLGDMQELGIFSKEAHQYVGELVKANPVDVLITVGTDSRLIGEKAGIATWQHFSDADEAASYVLAAAEGEHKCVLVQGARGLYLEIVIEALESGHLSLLPKSAPPHSAS